MTPLALLDTAQFSVRRVNERGPHPDFAAGDAVRFLVNGGLVRGVVRGLDPKARNDLPIGAPYRVAVTDAPPLSGYTIGSDCTIRAGCLEREGVAPVVMSTFLVAFMREGGNAPVQGALLVEGPTLEAASAAAMQMLTEELEADVRERGELPDAMVLLLNAAEVPQRSASTTGESVRASVTW